MVVQENVYKFFYIGVKSAGTRNMLFCTSSEASSPTAGSGCWTQFSSPAPSLVLALVPQEGFPNAPLNHCWQSDHRKFPNHQAWPLECAVFFKVLLFLLQVPPYPRWQSTQDLTLVSEDVIVNIEFAGNRALRTKDKGLHIPLQNLIVVGRSLRPPSHLSESCECSHSEPLFGSWCICVTSLFVELHLSSDCVCWVPFEIQAPVSTERVLSIKFMHHALDLVQQGGVLSHKLTPKQQKTVLLHNHPFAWINLAQPSSEQLLPEVDGNKYRVPLQRDVGTFNSEWPVSTESLP